VSKTDGGPAKGTVSAVLSNGGAEVQPSSTPVPADAQFAYTAAPERDQQATVALEARSKRGVGRATIDFDTKAKGYTASYSGDGLTITGTIDDLGAPFITNGTFPGGTATFTHIPNDERSGSLEVGGRGSGAQLSGGGTYTIVDNADGSKTMIENLHACVDVSGICRDSVHDVRLTPVS
jgi:hypothetical protein